MRIWLRIGLALPAAAVCLAAAPQQAAAHDEPFVSIATTRGGGIYLRLGHPHVVRPTHAKQLRAKQLRAERIRAARAHEQQQLLHRQQQLRKAAARALCAGEYRVARRLFARADRVRASERRYRGWR